MGLKDSQISYISKKYWWMNLNFSDESTWWYRFKKERGFICKLIFSLVWSKELSANQILGFLNPLYLKSIRVNKHDFFHTENEGWFVACRCWFKNSKSWFVNILLAWLKKLPANHILRFLNQLYLESNKVIQYDFLYADMDWRNVKKYLKIFSHESVQCFRMESHHR